MLQSRLPPPLRLRLPGALDPNPDLPGQSQAFCFAANLLQNLRSNNIRPRGHTFVSTFHQEVEVVDDTTLHSLVDSQSLPVNSVYTRDTQDPLIADFDVADQLNVVTKHHHYSCQPDETITAIQAAAGPDLRSLTLRFNGINDEMTTSVSPPSSPPGLSGSKSSKSSSLHSTPFSGPDGVLSDVSNFEDIGLDDEKHNAIIETHVLKNYNENKRLTSRVVCAAPHADPPVTSTRDLVTTGRPGYPTLHAHVKSAIGPAVVKPLRLPRNAGTMRRGFTSPSVPALPIASSDLQLRTRSTSPARRVYSSTSITFQDGTSPRPSPSSPRASLPVPSRRGSWQPNRKSIKELEAEYHDSDDDLPDEATLWNVPMSPRPPEERSLSARSSTRGSPERAGLPAGPPPIPLSHVISAPETLSNRGLDSQPLPKHRIPPPRTSSLNASAFPFSSPSSPQSRGSMRSRRAKSWTLAMAELSEEARVLTEVLEYHAGTTDKNHEERIQAGNKLSRPSLERNTRQGSRSSAIELPPVQKGSLDFMPISKEKEAILSRTRPSWLPPKDPLEEKRHLREYQRMMAASIEMDKRKEKSLLQQKCQKDDSREALNRIWEQYVNPAWNIVLSQRRSQQLWWRGVGPQVRGKVWQRAIGNTLALTDKSYAKALQRAKGIGAKASEDLGEKEKVMKGWFEDIEKDAETAFPELNLFQRHGPMWQDLQDVCEAYVCYRSDVGFLYGIHLISALLFLQLPNPTDVFILLANSLNRPMPLAFLTNDPGSTSRAYGIAISTLAIQFPRLHWLLFGSTERGGLALTGEEVFEPMFRTLFTNGLDLDRLSRVWDCWVFEGDAILVRTAVATLGCLESQIFGIEGPPALKRRRIVETFGWGPKGRKGGYWDLQSTGDEDAFMREVKNAGRTEQPERQAE